MPRDEDEEDEDDEDEEDEDDSLTLQDIKDGLDVVDKGIDVWNKLKKQSSHELELDPNKFKNYRSKPKPKIENFELAEHPDVKVEKRHKEIIKWTKVAIIIGGIIGVITIIIQLV